MKTAGKKCDKGYNTISRELCKENVITNVTSHLSPDNLYLTSRTAFQLNLFLSENTDIFELTLQS